MTWYSCLSIIGLRVFFNFVKSDVLSAFESDHLVFMLIHHWFVFKLKAVFHKPEFSNGNEFHFVFLQPCSAEQI